MSGVMVPRPVLAGLGLCAIRAMIMTPDEAGTETRRGQIAQQPALRASEVVAQQPGF